MSREILGSSMPEFRMFHQPTDTSAPREAPLPEVLRHMTPYGELSYDPLTGIVRSPLVSEERGNIHLADARTTSMQITIVGRILETLIRNPRDVLMHETLINVMHPMPSCKPQVSDLESEREAISLLRCLLGESPKKRIIRTVRFRGYTLATPEDLISSTNPKTISRQAPQGEIRYNDDALLATSPFINNGATPIGLTPQGAHMLNILMTTKEEAVKHSAFELFTIENTRVYASYLRRKLGDFDHALIETVPGGFRLARAA